MPVFINLPNTLASDTINEQVDLNVKQEEQSQEEENPNGT